MKKIFFDTETCGLHGPIVLYQYAIDDGPIILEDIWLNSIRRNLELFDELINSNVCGFNLAFDWFHVCQMVTTLLELKKRGCDLDCPMLEHKLAYYDAEPDARFGPCIKPISACDLMLHARRGPYQSTMIKDKIKIKKVHRLLSRPLADLLSEKLQLPDLLFAKKSNPRERWKVTEVDHEFDNVTLTFAPSARLKDLAVDALGLDVTQYKEISLGKNSYPEELGYAPWGSAVSGKTWKWVLDIHVEHWAYFAPARKYAEADVDLTRRLYNYFGSPDFGDDDSELACMVGAVRWSGMSLDLEKLEILRNEASSLAARAKHNFASTEVCKRYLHDVLNDQEKAAITIDGKESTKGVILEALAKWTDDEVCDACYGAGCGLCIDGLIKGTTLHPAAVRAREILDFRRARAREGNLDKLLQAGRFHPSVNIIGARSSRMSGADDFNPQGVNRDKRIRECFPLADRGLILCGGDFESFEISLMDAAYKDPVLREELLSGKKIHALFGEQFFPGRNYENILATKGKPNEEDLYDRSKKGVFALFYGGEGFTLANKVGIPEEIGQKAFENCCRKYHAWSAERRRIQTQFCSMKQENGIGSKITWAEPAEYIESLLGFRRYFTVENQVVRALFSTGEKPPKEWSKIQTTCVRREKEQTVCAAMRSALFAAAFAIQAGNMRAAANHRIQSTGAGLTKNLQRRIWDLQPQGINEWLVKPLNIHDELMIPSAPSIVDKIVEVKNNFLDEYRELVPLIAIDWKNGMDSWAGK
jgi:hypothetical protein